MSIWDQAYDEQTRPASQGGAAVSRVRALILLLRFEIGQLRQAAKMIDVPVGDNDAADAIRATAQMTVVGDDHIDAQHIVLGEHNAGIDDEHLVVVLEEHHVFPDFTQTAQGNYA